MTTAASVVEVAKLAAAFLVAVSSVAGVLGLAWLVWKRALLEAERVVSETWKRIAEGYENEVQQLRAELGEVRAEAKTLGRKVTDLEEAVDTYGCENAPSCSTRRPRRRGAIAI